MPSEATPTKEQIAELRRYTRRGKARLDALDSVLAPKLAAQAELRRESAIAVQEKWPRDIDQLEHVLWPSIQKYAEKLFDAIAEARLKSFGSKSSVRRFVHWLQCTCIPAVVDASNCIPLWDNAKHIHDTIGDARWPPEADKTRQALGRLMTEFLGGPHVESLEKRIRAVLSARVDHWEANAIEKQSSGREAEALLVRGTAKDPGVHTEAPRLTTEPNDFSRSKTEHTLPADESSEPSLHSEARDWTEVEIRFLSDQRVQISVGRYTGTLNYAEFGFEDRRKRTPSLAWIALRSLAEAGGTVPRAQNGREGAKLEKRMQEIRTILRNRFNLSADPLPFIKGAGYRTEFKINCAPSFNS